MLQITALHFTKVLLWIPFMFRVDQKRIHRANRQVSFPSCTNSFVLRRHNMVRYLFVNTGGVAYIINAHIRQARRCFVDIFVINFQLYDDRNSNFSKEATFYPMLLAWDRTKRPHDVFPKYNRTDWHDILGVESNTMTSRKDTIMTVVQSKWFKRQMPSMISVGTNILSSKMTQSLPDRS